MHCAVLEVAVGVGEDLDAGPLAGFLKTAKRFSRGQPPGGEGMSAELVARVVGQARFLADPLYRLIDRPAGGVAEHAIVGTGSVRFDESEHGLAGDLRQRDDARFSGLGRAQQGLAGGEVAVSDCQPAGFSHAASCRSQKQNDHGHPKMCRSKEVREPIWRRLVDLRANHFRRGEPADSYVVLIASLAECSIQRRVEFALDRDRSLVAIDLEGESGHVVGTDVLDAGIAEALEDRSQEALLSALLQIDQAAIRKRERMRGAESFPV